MRSPEQQAALDATIARIRAEDEARSRRYDEIVAAHPEFNARFDVRGALEFMQSLAEGGFGAPEEEYLEEFNELIRGSIW